MGGIILRDSAVTRLGSRFRRDREGATAVEFALVVVPFIGLLLAIFQTGFTFWTNEGLEAAVQDSARQLMTGNAQGQNVYTAAAFKTTYLCPTTGRKILPSSVDCSNLIIDVRTATSFTGADTTKDFTSTPSTTMFCPGGPQAIVIVRVAYPMPILLPVLVGNTTATIQQLKTGQVNNTLMLLGTAVFQNEPYAASNYTKPSGCP